MESSDHDDITNSESEITFQIWSRTYITNAYGDPIKSNDTDSISSIQIAISNSGYTGDVPTSVNEGQQLLATLIKTNFELDLHITGYPESYIEEIAEREPENPWRAEVFWAFTYYYQ